jgi:SAM-dependent methyltransferase
VVLLAAIRARDDQRFDQIYPPAVRQSSAVHWTPIEIALRATAFLVRSANTRVLDIGSGPGKFCLIGALATSGHYTGIEQRRPLCDIARKRIDQAGVASAAILEGDIADLDFSCFDAFYLFNPFGVHVGEAPAIDASVAVSAARYRRYVDHVAGQLSIAPNGTRVATYWGACDEIPAGYECTEKSSDGPLRLWEKRKQP